MDLELTEEHKMLQDSVKYFVKKEHSFERLRELKTDRLGYSKDLWNKMAGLGWMELIFPEKYGGQELELDFAMVLMEEFGRGMVPEPWLSTVLLGGNLILLGGTETQQQEILPKVGAGELLMTLAYLEDGGRFDMNYCATSAIPNEKGFILSGRKIFVLDGGIADMFVISTRTSGGISDKDGITLFILPGDAKGLQVTPLKTMDGRNACIFDLNDVAVSDREVVGQVDQGYPLLSDALDQATACLCAEMTGGMQGCLDMTVRHVSDRIQFNRPIGSFQAVQHKVADMFVKKELATSATYYAIASMVENTKEKTSAVSIAKAKCSCAYVEIAKSAIQLFGAFGFTNEADIGFFLKRAKVTEILFGDADYHYDRFATLEGY
jgi:acyl-CoA dehydrogenase